MQCFQKRAHKCIAESPAEITLRSDWQLQDVLKVTQPGDAVSRAVFAPSGWYDATVPGTVLTSLVNDGVYPEPLYGENDRPDKIPDNLCRTSYWYRTRFVVPPEYDGKNIWLNFHGINYMAEVWVNGHDVGGIKGAFARGIFDVTPYVRTGETNVVAVRIMPPPHPGVPHEHTAKMGTGPNGGILSEDGATFLCTLGWDWIPAIRDRDMGIWQKVTLSATGPGHGAGSDGELRTAAAAQRQCRSDARSNRSEYHRPAAQRRASRRISATSSFVFPVALAADESKIVKLTPAQIPQLHVTQPLLWWPNGYGPQNLYTMHLRFDVDGGRSDVKDFSFGIRKITYDVPGSENLDDLRERRAGHVQGRRLGHGRGDEAHSATSRLEAQIRMHQRCQLQHDPQLGRPKHQRRFLRSVRSIRHHGVG